MLDITPPSQDSTAIAERIDALREQLGKDLTIVGHHYQSDAIIRHTDLSGDSLELARKVANIDTRNIVFGGVFFMAESAALLASQGQRIFLPDHSADCPMAQMVPADILESVMQRLNSTGRRIVPLAYVNTSVAVKAVVGHYGGAVCTSANANTMLQWAMDQGDAVLFVPDKNLSQNTAKNLGIGAEQQHIIDIRQHGKMLDMDAVNKANLMIWPGYCPIHARFTTKQIAAMREAYPGCHVIVHPECSPEVVNASDAAGSTSFIIKYAQSLPKGTALIVGTESNLVKRMAAQYAGQLTIVPLLDATCSDMERITPRKLLHTLESIINDTAEDITVAPAMVEPARNSLTRMLDACSK